MYFSPQNKRRSEVPCFETTIVSDESTGRAGCFVVSCPCTKDFFDILIRFQDMLVLTGFKLYPTL